MIKEIVIEKGKVAFMGSVGSLQTWVERREDTADLKLPDRLVTSHIRTLASATNSRQLGFWGKESI